MTRTTQCTNCGVVLNIPPEAVGKRLKCPKCGTKFHALSPEAKAPSGALGVSEASADSSQEIKRKGHGDIELPTAAGDLRDSFDLPMLAEDSSPGPARTTTANRLEADALALFDDGQKPAPRRPNAAEARSKARRCPTCGGAVPIGMSLCQTCGLDLESGTRIDLAEDLAPPPPPSSGGLPIGVLAAGGICFLGSLALAAYSTMQSFQGVAGWRYFIPVCLFGIFASVHLLRGKSAKLLLAALTLGAALDIIALIIMPVFAANFSEAQVEHRVVNPADPDAEDQALRPVAENLDLQKITWGIALLVGYGLVSVYLISPAATKHRR